MNAMEKWEQGCLLYAAIGGRGTPYLGQNEVVRSSSDGVVVLVEAESNEEAVDAFVADVLKNAAKYADSERQLAFKHIREAERIESLCEAFK